MQKISRQKSLYKRAEKTKELAHLPEGKILSSIDILSLYPNIPHDEGLTSLKNVLDSGVNKQVKTDTVDGTCGACVKK